MLSAEIYTVSTSYVIQLSLSSFLSPSSLYCPVSSKAVANSHVKESLFMEHKQGGHRSLQENKGHKNKEKKTGKNRYKTIHERKRLLNESGCDRECLLACTGAQEKAKLIFIFSTKGLQIWKHEIFSLNKQARNWDFFWFKMYESLAMSVFPPTITEALWPSQTLFFVD